MNENRNPVLIGMPTAGKTTLGKLLSKELGRELIEMDDEIVRKAGMPVTEIFRIFGETYFRMLETEVCREISGRENAVISCGGGVIKNPENMKYLSGNGLIIWLDRKPELLFASAERPLAADRISLKRLYEERKDLYAHYADLRIENNGTPEECLKEIITQTGLRRNG